MFKQLGLIDLGSHLKQVKSNKSFWKLETGLRHTGFKSKGLNFGFIKVSKEVFGSAKKLLSNVNF